MHFVLLVLPLLWAGSFAQDVSATSVRPRCSGPHEVFTKCYSPCEKTCYTRFRSDGKVCTEECRPGCTCEPGYLRHDNGTCVEEYYCSPPKCNKDELYNPCGTCEKDCKTKDNTCLFCIAACIPGCYCKKGTIRSSENISCIKPEQCPKPVCGCNEVFDKCPNQCFSGYCRDIWSRYNCSKAPDCCEPKCVCKSGYYRNKRGVCITTEECIRTQGNQ